MTEATNSHLGAIVQGSTDARQHSTADHYVLQVCLAGPHACPVLLPQPPATWRLQHSAAAERAAHVPAVYLLRRLHPTDDQDMLAGNFPQLTAAVSVYVLDQQISDYLDMDC